MGRSYFSVNNVRPSYRGFVHEYGFYLTLLSSVPLFYHSNDIRTHCIIVVYIGTLLLLYGVSACYHQTLWLKEANELVIQRLDHSCIYLLVAGSYAPWMLIIVDDNERYLSSRISLLQWILAFCGIIKTYIYKNSIPSYNIFINCMVHHSIYSSIIQCNGLFRLCLCYIIH